MKENIRIAELITKKY